MAHQPKVLIVDDDENIVSAFEDFFRKERCTLVSASNVKDALGVITHQSIDLVITDIRMKWQSGVTLLVELKQLHPRLPVIVITGYPNMISEADIREIGADYYFVKPLELDQLRSAVRDCLNRPAVSAHRNM
jgi:DNA-binding NtrC family response regulator